MALEDTHDWQWKYEKLKAQPIKVAIIVNAGCVSAVYSDNAKVEVEIVDQDGQEEGERDAALKREDEIAGECISVL